jgi:hypothetical protein
MDEIDAALDFRNVSIVANYIKVHPTHQLETDRGKERTKNAQFIVISLRNNMFELAARLVGIYKTSNMVIHIAETGGLIGRRKVLQLTTRITWGWYLERRQVVCYVYIMRECN